MKFHADIYKQAAPVVGVVKGSQRVESRRFHMGFRVTVQRPNGATETLRASDFDKQVRAFIPKNVNLRQPSVKAGEVREVFINGYSWFGTVEKVTHENFLVRPKALTLPDGKVFTDGEPMIFGDVGELTRESVFMFSMEAGIAKAEFQTEVRELKDLNDPRWDAARETYRAKIAASRAKYPDITDREEQDLAT